MCFLFVFECSAILAKLDNFLPGFPSLRDRSSLIQRRASPPRNKFVQYSTNSQCLQIPCRSTTANRLLSSCADALVVVVDIIVIRQAACFVIVFS